MVTPALDVDLVNLAPQNHDFPATSWDVLRPCVNIMHSTDIPYYALTPN